MSKQIESLTSEQEAQLEVYKEKWIKIGLSTEPTNRAIAEDAILRAYDAANQPRPKTIYWTESPEACILKSVEISGLSASEILSNSCYGQLDADWLSFYNYFLEVLDVKDCEVLRPMMTIAEHVGWWVSFDEAVVASEKPVSIKMEKDLLHNEMGPAIAYKDGFEVFAINGQLAKKEDIKRAIYRGDMAQLLEESESLQVTEEN
jgi:hypothetical protein